VDAAEGVLGLAADRLHCGRLGCCDSSPHRHASAHARSMGHPIARSAEPGENWRWSSVDNVAFVVSER
jgi:hypothetical protein